jgi:hypothetical protein
VALELPRLPQGQPIADPNGMPSLAFTVYWQQFCEALEAQEAAQDDLIADILAAQTAADAAATAAAAAQSDADAVAREAARISSYPNPGSILTATDAGSDATITIANHTRVYPVQGSIDIPDVSITGAAIAGLPFSTRHYIYYDDATLADTTPNFVATTTAATAQVGAAAGRHFVGYITTPADGAAPSSGQGGGTPGSGGGGGTGGTQPDLP